MTQNTLLTPLPQQPQYPAPLTLEPRSASDGRAVWKIDYANSPEFLGRSFSDFFDEMRALPDAAGSVLGRVYLRPGSSRTPLLPVPLPTITFQLFQVCDGDGGYPASPESRRVF